MNNVENGIDQKNIVIWLVSQFQLQLWYIGSNDVRQREMHTVKPILPEPSPLEIEIAI
jgi:hypothetical protein